MAGIRENIVDFQLKNNLLKENPNPLYNSYIILLKQKLFLEKLLHLIKIFQTEFLSQNNNNDIKNKQKNSSNLKSILINLKNDLIIILKDNINDKAKIQNITSNNKSSLFNNLFDFHHPLDTKLPREKSLTKSVIIKKNTIQTNDKKELEYSKELSQLRMLNFKIENQLKYMDVVIKLKRESLSDFKHSLIKFEEENVHIFCSNQNDINKASNYLHDDLIKIRNEFKSIVKKKENQNRILELYKSKVIIMKEDVEIMKEKSKNDYINTSDIINEDSREYYTRTNICTIENYLNSKKEYEDINNNFIKKNLIRINKIN
jgi:hypothetical protein